MSRASSFGLLLLSYVALCGNAVCDCATEVASNKGTASRKCLHHHGETSLLADVSTRIR